MKRILKLLIFVMFPIISITHGHYKKPVFESSVEYVSKSNSLPLEMILGKSEGKDLAYIKGWGRKFLVEAKNGYVDTLNNFSIFDNGKSLIVQAQVVMVDLHGKYPQKYAKGTFYHSNGGFLHSHIYPNADFSKVKIDNVEYEMVEQKDEFSKRSLFVEKNGKFTILPIKKMLETDPDMVYFTFKAEFEKK